MTGRAELITVYSDGELPQPRDGPPDRTEGPAGRLRCPLAFSPWQTAQKRSEGLLAVV